MKGKEGVHGYTCERGDVNCFFLSPHLNSALRCSPPPPPVPKNKRKTNKQTNKQTTKQKKRPSLPAEFSFNGSLAPGTALTRDGKGDSRGGGGATARRRSAGGRVDGHSAGGGNSHDEGDGTAGTGADIKDAGVGGQRGTSPHMTVPASKPVSAEQHTPPHTLEQIPDVKASLFMDALNAVSLPSSPHGGRGAARECTQGI